MSDYWDNDRPQSLGFSGQGLSNINLGTGYNAKFTPLVTAVDLDRSNSLDKQQSRYLSDNTLDKLAIYVPKLIQYSLTYGVQLTMIILGTLLVKGCDRTPELSIMTIIMGTLYAVCWLIRGKTGKLAKIVKSVCYTAAAFAFIVLVFALYQAIFKGGDHCYNRCSPTIIAIASIFALGVTATVVKLKVFDPVAKELKSRKTYKGVFY